MRIVRIAAALLLVSGLALFLRAQYSPPGCPLVGSISGYIPPVCNGIPVVTRVGLAAEYLMTETSGTIAHETSNPAYNVTLPAVGATWANGGLHFADALGQPAALNPIPSSLYTQSYTGSLTLEIWVRMDSFPPDPGWTWFIDLGNVRIAAGPLDSECSGELRDANGAWLGGGVNDVFIDLSFTPIPTLTWTHFIAVFNAASSSVQLYLNGAPLPTSQPTKAFVGFSDRFTQPNILSIGNDQNQEGIIGTVGQVRIYHRALASYEARGNYLASKGTYGL